MDSPCLTCTRVKDPSSCENKMCSPWRRWFLCKWAKLRAKYIGYIKEDDE